MRGEEKERNIDWVGGADVIIPVLSACLITCLNVRHISHPSAFPNPTQPKSQTLYLQTQKRRHCTEEYNIQFLNFTDESVSSLQFPCRPSKRLCVLVKGFSWEFGVGRIAPVGVRGTWKSQSALIVSLGHWGPLCAPC